MSDNDFDVINHKLDKIIELLSERSKEVLEEEITSEHVSGVNLEDNTVVSESIKGMVSVVTAKAVKVIVGKNYAWIPKKCVKNLDKIVLEEGKIPEIVLQDWFKEKIEWKAI